MPALMVKRPSVAPASSVGTTGTPGHICELTASTGPTISRVSGGGGESVGSCVGVILILSFARTRARVFCTSATGSPDRKSTRLNSSHGYISYAVFCLKKKNKKRHIRDPLRHVL